MNEISVVVIDDHPLIIEAISGVLRRERNGFKVVGVGVSASDIVDLCERNAPNIAIVDLHMPGDVYAAIGRVLIVSKDSGGRGNVLAIGKIRGRPHRLPAVLNLEMCEHPLSETMLPVGARVEAKGAAGVQETE